MAAYTIGSNKLGTWLTLSATAAGALTGLLGLVVLIGWYTHDLVLLRVNPHFVAMASNTALGFLASGIGLVFAAIRRKTYSRIAGTVVVALGLLTILEYIVHRPLGIDQILVKAYVRAGIIDQARMAVCTALCFTLTGASILILAAQDRLARIGPTWLRLWSTGGPAVLGACAAGFGLVAFSAYATGVQEAYTWGQLTRMAAHTSIGFIVLGIGVANAAWRIELDRSVSANSDISDRSAPLPRWLPGLIGVIVVSVTLCLWQALVVRESADVAIIERLSALAGVPIGSVAARQSLLPMGALSAGMLLACAISFAVYLVQMAHRRAYAIAAVNDKLTAEIAQRIIAEESLRRIREELERRVEERTAQVAEALASLEEVNLQLLTEIANRTVLEREREVLLTEALERADRDPLTGLWNHRSFQKRLDEESDRTQRANSTFAIAVVDVDNFKFFNEVYGHAAGDAALCSVASALGSFTSPEDFLARFGGDEFVLVLPLISLREADLIPGRIKKALDDLSFTPPDTTSAIPLTVSTGVAVFPADGSARLDLIETAESRLRRAKAGGDAAGGYCDILRTELLGSCEGFRMLDALLASVDNKDRYTRKHSEDVLIHSVAIAREMGVDIELQKTIAIAALLHDVGKIGVPDAILRKPGKLTDDEYEAIKLHPTMGATIVEAVSGFEPMLDAIRHHHERWDGAGYPLGLSGKDTPFFARLMAVADAFSAMTTDRPYRKGMHPEAAAGILADGAGTQWDPECVAALLRAQGTTATPSTQHSGRIAA